jgi:putative hemolysin
VEADLALRLLLYFGLLLLSGFFSGSETAMFSLGRVRLLRMHEEGHPNASLIESLLARPRRLIATIFIGNEFVNIGASALLAGVMHRHLSPHGDTLVTVVSTCVSVALILLLGEITPKNVAAQTVERWAATAARPISLLAVMMAPLRWVIERIADIVVGLVGDRVPRPAASVGENEFRTMVDVVSAGGELDQREMELIHNVFEFGDRRVGDVMTPADAVLAVPYDQSLGWILERVRSNRFSRIPVYRGRRERVIGVLYAKDLIGMVHRVPSSAGQTTKEQSVVTANIGIRSLLHPPYFVPRATKCEQLLRVFRRRRIHMAIVVDEYGNFAGLITMEDLLEEMFGEIMDEKEITPPVAPEGAPSE